ncbi:hypothetical protein JDV09_18100 [Mycobacterium sp. Y57]|uniref:hypothetical protein n=1 Tax=Mycolicibacterium xanthum TaxID=2796469 RepID=UPI001C853379|nr:hypothetical protein [Mycolicibacterium xanthum]MBX7434010.1 hypothetical protein [Mycolicibacterium xanthum]
MKPEWKAYEYSYRIHWSPDNRRYVASVAEFPAMQSTPEVTPKAALDALMTDVVAKLAQLDGDGQSFPAAEPVTGAEALKPPAGWFGSQP